MKKTQYITIYFASQADWEKWLKKEHSIQKGIWIKLAKKNSEIPTITHQEALETALCYGWIDAQSHGFDDKYWLLKFTPRGAKSVWSKRNCEIVERLKAENKMQPAGLAAVAAAQKDGRWEAAYDSPKNMTMPEEFLKELTRNKKAKEFFDTLNKANTYAIGYRLQTAKKPETKQKRIKKIIEMLAKEKKLH